MFVCCVTSASKFIKNLIFTAFKTNLRSPKKYPTTKFHSGHKSHINNKTNDCCANSKSKLIETQSVQHSFKVQSPYEKPQLLQYHSAYKAQVKHQNQQQKSNLRSIHEKNKKTQKNPRTQFIHHVNLTSNNKNHD